LATGSPDGSHVLAISAHDFTPSTSGNAGLIRRELVSAALCVCCLTALASNLALTVGRHRCEATALLGLCVL
jgi:hypothetical protein